MTSKFVFRKSSTKKGKNLIPSVPESNPTINVEEDQDVDEEGYQSDEETSEDDTEEDDFRRELFVNGMIDSSDLYMHLCMNRYL